MKKNIIIIVGIILIISFVLIFYARLNFDKNLERELLQEIKYKDDIFAVYDQEAPTSFNSNNKILSLQDNKGDIIDEKRFGAHPLIIESVDDNNSSVNSNNFLRA